MPNFLMTAKSAMFSTGIFFLIFNGFQTTGLTGLAVSRNPHQILNILHTKILRCVQKMPQDAAYRKYTEQIILERDAAVKAVSIYIILPFWLLLSYLK